MALARELASCSDRAAGGSPRFVPVRYKPHGRAKNLVARFTASEQRKATSNGHWVGRWVGRGGLRQVTELPWKPRSGLGRGDSLGPPSCGRCN